MKKLDSEKKMVKIINAMEIVEMSQPTIARKAIVSALTADDDEEASLLFEQLRVRASLTDDDAFTVDGYIHNLSNLRSIAALSDQKSVSQDLDFLIDFFTKNSYLLMRVLKKMKRFHVYEGLKQNYMNN